MTLTVAVLAGGRSAEHDVSLSSGAAVRDGLLEAGHDVLWVEIGRDGAWRCEERELSLVPAAGLLGADVVFPVLHGPFGEDGTVQGLLETLDVAYVGAGVAASALCLDKVLFKELMSARGVPQVDFLGVRRERLDYERSQVLEQAARLGLPVFVKPARMGSSLGIAKVTEDGALEAALEQAFAYDELAIIEAAASGVEVECGVLGLLAEEAEPGEIAFISEPGEIAFTSDFYDYDAKYAPGGMELRVPASISASACERLTRMAADAFLATGCEGLARVDFFVASSADGGGASSSEGERVILNELNTLPGFTPTSVYAKLLAASGVPYPRLLDRLCRLGLERHARRRALTG
jgi:D-alanine-D-alanine ligase